MANKPTPSLFYQQASAIVILEVHLVSQSLVREKSGLSYDKECIAALPPLLHPGGICRHNGNPP